MSSNQREVLKKIFCINFLLPRRWSVCIRHCITWPPPFSSFSLSKLDLTCPKKTNCSLYAMFSCSAVLELAQDFVWMYSRWSLRPTPLHTLCTTHAKHALLELVGRRLGLLLSSEATMLLALLGLGATLSREDYRRRARKGLPGATQVSFSVQPLAIPGRCQQGTKIK